MPKRMIDWMHEPECCRDVPLLAIEINGGQQSFEELIDKRDLYFTHGVASVWVAHPMFKQIDIFCPQSPYPQIIKSGDAEDHATGLLVRIEEIFA